MDEAIGIVATSSRPIRDEHHLEGAFWRTVGLLLSERRAGRHDLRVGSRRRVEFDPVERDFASDGEPFDVVEARDRLARANDLIAQLDPFERRVFSIMAAYGIGAKVAARALGEPEKTVLAAARSAERKLDVVAVIAAAGRMCAYRSSAIREHAHGTAEEPADRVARAHLAACAACRAEYATLLREMRGREFKRAACAAFLPAPAALPAAHRWLERLTALLPAGRGPAASMTAERAGVMLGGGAGVKVAAGAVTTVLVVASVGASAIHSLTSRPATHPTVEHIRHSHRRIVAPAERAQIPAAPLAIRPRRGGSVAVDRRARRSAPPSRDLGYLALGGSPASTSTGSPRAAAANVGSSTTSSSARVAEDSSTPPPSTGGGAGLGYLGR